MSEIPSDVLDEIEEVVAGVKRRLVALCRERLAFQFKPEFHGAKGRLRLAKLGAEETQQFPPARGGRKGARE